MPRTCTEQNAQEVHLLTQRKLIEKSSCGVSEGEQIEDAKQHLMAVRRLQQFTIETTTAKTDIGGVCWALSWS